MRAQRSERRRMDRIAETLFRQTIASPDDIYHLLPRELWSVAPDPDSVQLGERHVLLTGAAAHGQGRQRRHRRPIHARARGGRQREAITPAA